VIEIHRSKIPAVETHQMIEIDRTMMEDYRIELIQMMENAGRNLAHLARERFLGGNPAGKHILVLAGSGANGGGALVAARRLSNWGARVTVGLGREPETMTPIPAHQLDILQRMKIAGTKASAKTNELEKNSFDLILDGLIGYGLKGDPLGLIAVLIRQANASGVPILALDAPSGVNTSTGEVFKPAIKASATLTLALPKKGLIKEGISNYTGELYLADISVPPVLYESLGLSMKAGPLFAESEIIRVI